MFIVRDNIYECTIRHTIVVDGSLYETYKIVDMVQIFEDKIIKGQCYGHI